jgi:hypothetical protein
MTKCEVQGPMRSKVCLGVKHTCTNGGECKGWSPMTPKCSPTLGVALVQELWMFRALVEKTKNAKLGPQDNIRKVLKCTCLNCPRIIHLDLICMNYDQKKSRSQIGNLTPNQKSLESRGQMKSDWGMLYTVGKILSDSTWESRGKVTFGCSP